MAYFDNAATTYPKPDVVYDFMDRFYRRSGGNAGRGMYPQAESAGNLIEETRTLVQELLHCPAKQVIFQPTATISLNIIIQGLISNGARNVYISPFEHNAVTRTLYPYQQKGIITVQQLSVSKGLQYDLERIRYQFDELRPDIVIVSHASNVIGLVAPIEKIFTLSKKYGAYTVADMSQTAGLIDINTGLECFDFAVFAGHKTLYGPTGVSGFVMDPAIDLPPLLFGGTGFDSANQNMPETLPQKYECGTIDILGIAGLNAALRWIRKQGIREIRKREEENRRQLLDILNSYSFLKVIGISGEEYVGVVSCLMEGISSDTAGTVFAKKGISVRAGLECAPLAHQFLGTYPSGTIRFSVSYFTSEIDFKSLKDALDEIDEDF